MTMLQVLRTKSKSLAKPETAESILDALAAGISERKECGLPYGELADIDLAIYELKKLRMMPASELRTTRVNQLIAQFGKADVDRWLALIRVTPPEQVH